MRKWLVSIVIGSVGWLACASAFAQQPDKPDASTEKSEMRARVLVDDASGAKVTRPEGWVSAKRAKGEVAVFRAADDSKAQIEVRVSPHVKAEQRDSFFASFQSSLQKAGFVKHAVRKKAIYGGKSGDEVEFAANSKSSKFRLILWQFHRGDSAILVVGFFPTPKRDQYYPAFQQVIKDLTFK